LRRKQWGENAKVLKFRLPSTAIDGSRNCERVTGNRVALLKTPRKFAPSFYEIVPAPRRLFALYRVNITFFVFASFAVLGRACVRRETVPFDWGSYIFTMCFLAFLFGMIECIRFSVMYISRRRWWVKLEVYGSKLVLADVSWTPDSRSPTMFRCALKRCRIVPDLPDSGQAEEHGPPMRLDIPVQCCFVRFWVRLHCGLTPEARQEWDRLFAAAQPGATP
jgi:hypothetical protein